jgi:hypothetical protein
MGITAGRALVQAGAPPVVMGWRKRLVTRLALSAEPGEIVCDDSLLELVQQFQFRDLGQRHFRGLNQDLRLHGRPLADMPPLMLPPGGDFSGSFFARAEQLRLPQRLLAGLRPGQPAGLCISAEPGAGKTRLAWEFAQRVQREGGLAFWISAVPEAQNVPWRGLHDFFGKLLNGGTRDQLARIEQQLQAPLGEAARQAILGLLAQHGVAQTQHAALAEGISALLRGPGLRQVLVVVDDVQWLDQPSAAILNRVIQRADPVLWLLTRRQGERHALQITPLHEQPLQALDDQAAAAILNSCPMPTCSAPKPAAVASSTHAACPVPAGRLGAAGKRQPLQRVLPGPAEPAGRGPRGHGSRRRARHAVPARGPGRAVRRRRGRTGLGHRAGLRPAGRPRRSSSRSSTPAARIPAVGAAPALRQGHAATAARRCRRAANTPPPPCCGNRPTSRPTPARPGCRPRCRPGARTTSRPPAATARGSACWAISTAPRACRPSCCMRTA